MRANQLRQWFASMAYVLVTALRRIGLAGTELATATCGTIRLKLLKISALVTRSVRRIRVAMASSCPTPPTSASPTPDCAADPQSSPIFQRHQQTPALIAPRRCAQPRLIPAPQPHGSMTPPLAALAKVPVRNAS